MPAAAQQDVIQLLNSIRVELTGASDGGIKNALYEAFHEFFSDSSAWMENIDIAVIPTSVAYDLVPGDGGRIIRLAGVVDVNGIPQQALMPSVGTLVLRYAQNVAQTWTVTVIKTVSLPTSRDQIPIVPEWVLPVFREAILGGVLGRMLRQPNKSYTDKQSAVYHLQRFRKGITDARVAALKRNTVGAQAWRFPQGFQTRSQKGGVSTGNATRF